MNKSLGRIISLFMGIILLVGCTGNKIDNKINQNTVASESNSKNISVIPSSSTPETKEPQELSVLLPADKKILIDIFRNMATAEGYKLELQTPQPGLTYQAALETALINNKMDLFWVANEVGTTVAGEESIPLLDMNTKEATPTLQALAGMVPVQTRILNDEAVYGLPVGMYAKGTLVNLPMITALLGGENTIAVRNDLMACTPKQWAVLIQGVSKYLIQPQRIEIELNTTKYIMPAYRPEAAKGLRGVYSMATGEASSYFENLLEISYAAAFSTSSELLAATAEEQATVLDPILRKTLDLFASETISLAGENNSFSRGESFVQEERFTTEEAEKLFVDGTALFYRGDSSLGLRFEQENQQLAGNLALIPTKLDWKTHIDTEDEYRIYNRFAVGVEGYLCINAESKKAEEASVLLVRLLTSQEGMQTIEKEMYLLPFSNFYPRNVLLGQLSDGIAAGNIYTLPASKDSLLNAQRRLGEWTQLELMGKEEWTEEEYNAFITAALSVLGAYSAEIKPEE